MKRITAIAATFILSASYVFAADVGFNPEAYLEANPDVRAAGLTAYQHINMISGADLDARLAGMTALMQKASPARQVKILFCACAAPGSSLNNSLNPNGGFDENSTLQPWQDWYWSRTANQTTVKQMLMSGWTIQSIIPRGGSVSIDQVYLVFVK